MNDSLQICCRTLQHSGLQSQLYHGRYVEIVAGKCNLVKIQKFALYLVDKVKYYRIYITSKPIKQFGTDMVTLEVLRIDKTKVKLNFNISVYYTIASFKFL